MVKSLTNDILVPADAEMTLEGYLDERGYVEPEGPYGEYMGYYGAIHMDPVFHCTAITMRADVLHHTLLHGSAFVLDQTDSAVISAMRAEADAMRILKGDRARAGRGLSARGVRRRQHAAGLDQAARVTARRATRSPPCSAASCVLKHVYVFDEDIDIHDDRQVDWAMGTRFQADQDLVVLHGMMGMTMDPSLNGRRTGAKSGFDCTKPFGRDGEIPLMRCAAKVFKGPARYQTVEQALGSGADVLCRYRRVARQPRRPRSRLRARRTAPGRHASAATATAAIICSQAKPGVTGIVGELYHDPNAGT